MKNCCTIIFSIILYSQIFVITLSAQDNSPGNIASNTTNKINLSEKQEKIYLNLAESLYNDGEYVRALSIYLDFLDLYPDSTYTVRAMETLADLYEKQQRFSEALSVYESLYQRTGPSSNKGIYYYYNQARILNAMGYVEKASQIYQDIIKINPDSPYAKKSQINNKLNDIFK
ncbi:MAG: tetratricopeptide repeat protein [Spirochaetia bacterium]|nr:tetratricopeptide repeat protein [Spirochaetia bacterium]